MLGRKCGRPKVKFCIHDHDISIVGRTKDGKCRECLRISRRKRYVHHPKKKTQFCPQGHDKDVVGKNAHGCCKECKREKKRKYKPGERPKKQICVNNHDTFVCGRSSIGRCNQCGSNDQKQYRIENPKIIKISMANSRAKRKSSFVQFGQKGVKEFYDKMPDGMTGDHIIPLVNDDVKGLHVIWNLQYLTPSKNSSKSNKCNLLQASEWYGKILEKAGLK
jgi:hypothetical protein